MTRGVRFYSTLEGSGYALAAIAWVRTLVNAGVAVEWIPMQYTGGRLLPFTPAQRADPASLRFAHDDAALIDLPALLAQTADPIVHDTVVMHCVPEHWRALIEPGKRNIGCTTWETDGLPTHWPPLLDSMDAVIVNSRHDLKVFGAAGLRVPLHAVPIVRRHAWNEFAAGEVESARAQFGIPTDDFVFYTIGTWQPRKAMPQLLRTFAQAFDGDAAVSLIVKTSPRGHGHAPFYRESESHALAQHELDVLADELGRELPNVCLLPYEIGGRGIDLLHNLGDCYISLSHGEGWGMGAYDAAALGTPVIMTGWGGQCDFLGDDWPGRVPYRLVAASTWPPHQPSYWSSQRWAEADLNAASRLMQQVRRDPHPARAAAAATQFSLLKRYAEPRVAAAFLAVLNG